MLFKPKASKVKIMPYRLKALNYLFLKIIPFVGILISSAAGAPAAAGGVKITNFGHSALLINGGGKSILTNPFKAVGCAAGLQEPKVNANIVLASSELADEGAKVAKTGIFLVEPGSYKIKGLNLEGFAAPHDRLGGRRFGQATIWRWDQGGLSFAHLGGSAAPLTGEAKVLIGSPDVLIIGVGGGAKVYNGKEAAEIIKELNPRRVIPVQYRKAKSLDNCDLQSIKPFLEAIKPIKVRPTGKTITIPKNLGKETIVELMK